MKRYLIWTVLGWVWLGSAGFAPSETQLYSKAIQFAKAGQGHFAFMQYSELLRNYPTSKYRDLALFATGEYYFQVSGFQDAEKAFKMFLDEYPDARERTYALAYLLNIARRNDNAASAEDLKKQIIDRQQVSFVFRESKEVTYRSALNQNYKTVIYIDKIEFYVEGKLLAKVSY
jgi:outer membrane protein assembly factor BamD (BamD/ComL family)